MIPVAAEAGPAFQTDGCYQEGKVVVFYVNGIPYERPVVSGMVQFPGFLTVEDFCEKPQVELEKIVKQFDLKPVSSELDYTVPSETPEITFVATSTPVAASQEENAATGIALKTTGQESALASLRRKWELLLSGGLSVLVIALIYGVSRKMAEAKEEGSSYATSDTKKSNNMLNETSVLYSDSTYDQEDGIPEESGVSADAGQLTDVSPDFFLNEAFGGGMANEGGILDDSNSDYSDSGDDVLGRLFGGYGDMLDDKP